MPLCDRVVVLLDLIYALAVVHRRQPNTSRKTGLLSA